MKNNSYSVAVLGAGNIGSAVISRLLQLDNEVININLSKVLVSDSTKDRSFDSDLTTEDFSEIENDEKCFDFIENEIIKNKNKLKTIDKEFEKYLESKSQKLTNNNGNTDDYINIMNNINTVIKTSEKILNNNLKISVEQIEMLKNLPNIDYIRQNLLNSINNDFKFKPVISTLARSSKTTLRRSSNTVAPRSRITWDSTGTKLRNKS